ncbi:ABC transporter substrate-binding protein [Robbsia andropogonis]|uniref:ABC transporter substrate-binding protein n=1 Tax=Robbsia andropogonis TaxID=28092 RepID=UPI0004659EDB|nr:PotD/PotF family extracellular solute-binding protein [Robbsia andropogonis]MCP1119544.1 PotD/PotF family extracellular solute-binding protein [Robbsia andropogonis]MCP1129527.1 PotD/PotF family extracellular solute-binding protein [Robbsia andropogonis]
MTQRHTPSLESPAVSGAISDSPAAGTAREQGAAHPGQAGAGGLSRRTFLKGAAAGAGIIGFPYVHAQEKVTLRYVGTAVNQSADIAKKFQQDTGITIQYISLTSDDVTKRIITQPNSFDICDTEYFSLPKLIPAGVLQGMDVKKIKSADQIATVLTRGEVAGKAVGEQGTAPKKVMFLEGQRSTTLSKSPTEWMTLIPTTYNADTLGIRPDLIKRPINSWAELLNPEFKGRAALLNIPSIGIMDAAMAIEAQGHFKYADKGNMTKAEIDQTIKILVEAKRAGQFRAFWKDFNESVNLMASGEVVIQSMWSPAVTKVRTMGVACVFQPLKEGYRGWASGFGLPKTLQGRKLDAAYEFINWFQDGWAGAYLMRQGYYPGVTNTARKFMQPYEWDYWMEGKPATQDIHAPDGQLLEKAGTVRDGGSYDKRLGAVACWNAVMDQNIYLVQKWNEFISA